MSKQLIQTTRLQRQTNEDEIQLQRYTDFTQGGEVSGSVQRIVQSKNALIQRVGINLQPTDKTVQKLVSPTILGKLGISDVPKTLDSFSTTTKYKIGKTENIYVFGHGGESDVLMEEHNLIGNFHAGDLAMQLADIINFPNGYKGSVYLVGCKTDSLIDSLEKQLKAKTMLDIKVMGTVEILEISKNMDITVREPAKTTEEIEAYAYKDYLYKFKDIAVDETNAYKKIFETTGKINYSNPKTIEKLVTLIRKRTVRINDLYKITEDDGLSLELEGLDKTLSPKLQGKLKAFNEVFGLMEQIKLEADTLDREMDLLVKNLYGVDEQGFKSFRGNIFSALQSNLALLKMLTSKLVSMQIESNDFTLDTMVGNQNEVENEASSSSWLPYIVGVGGILIGSALFGYYYKYKT